VALEYNIPPAEDADQLVDHIGRVMAFLGGQVQQMGLSFSQESAARFPAAELAHPMAQEFGCDPDYNAWKNGEINPRPRAKDKTLRSCGGHVHIGGVPFASQEDIWYFIKLLDLYLSVPATLMDKDDRRKELYGKPGAFRYKPYGCEYRSLSNFWIVEDKTDWVWDSVSLAVDAWRNKKNIDDDAALILETVDHNNKLMAERLVEKHGLLVA
jgi:hypothetical protein